MKLRKIKQHTILIGLTMLICSFILVVGVTATTPIETLGHKTPITFGFTNVHDGNFERMWFSDGILHLRGAPHDGIVSGDLLGTLTYTGDINLNMETYDGTGQGILCLSVTYGDLSGTFRGRMVIKVNGGIITAMFICHGDGDFEGMKLKGTGGGIMNPETIYLADAIILNPHG